MKSEWEFKDLTAVSAINYGYTESASSDPVGPRFLRITDIQDDQVDWESVPYCKIESVDLPKYRLARGDIVFARTGATTGKSFLVDDPPEAVFASYLIRLRLLDKKLLPEFVSLFFQTDGYWKSIKDGSAGSAQGGFNATKLGALSIPIPPLPEQQRIVGILDEAFEGIATAKANAEKNLQNARALFESHLQSVFTQRGEGWDNHKQLEDLTEPDSPITYGVVKPGDEGEITFIRGGDLARGQILAGQLRTITQEVSKQYIRTLLRGGELLISLVGQPGQVAVVPPELARANIARQVGLIRLSARMNAEFVRFFLQSPVGQSALGARQSGSVQQVINLGELRQVLIPMPTRKVQAEVVEDLVSFTKDTRRLESIYQQKLAALEALKKSLLHQAFSGHL